MPGIPDRFLPHVVTIITPSTTEDRYGDTVYDYDTPAATRVVKAYMQPQPGPESTDSQQTSLDVWRFFSLDETLVAEERVMWNGNTFHIYMDPAIFTAPGGKYHHTEAVVRSRS